jgi:3-oxoacyl-[acyl-carrier protein] reductase
MVNLRAPYLLARRVLPSMCKAGFGRVLFSSSVAAFTGGLVGPHYAGSKAGFHGLTHYLAARAAPPGVTVNAIAPALIAGTDMLRGDPDHLATLIGRLGTPEEVADLAMAKHRQWPRHEPGGWDQRWPSPGIAGRDAVHCPKRIRHRSSVL